MIGPGAGARVMVTTRPVGFLKGPDALAALVGAAMTGKHVLALVGHVMSLSTKDATRAATGSYVRRFLRFLRWADLSDQDLARFVPRTPC
jgi:hypothetical protein